METETLDRLFLELSQVTTAKTKRESDLERALNRQSQSHKSIAMVLRGPPTEGGMESCITQCDKLAAEADETLQPKAQEPRTADLVMLVGRLVQQVRKHDAANPVAEKAMDYLRRKELSPSILREVRNQQGQVVVAASDADFNEPKDIFGVYVVGQVGIDPIAMFQFSDMAHAWAKQNYPHLHQVTRMG